MWMMFTFTWAAKSAKRVDLPFRYAPDPFRIIWQDSSGTRR
jgi:hypothetical protein